MDASLVLLNLPVKVVPWPGEDMSFCLGIQTPLCALSSFRMLELESVERERTRRQEVLRWDTFRSVCLKRVLLGFPTPATTEIGARLVRISWGVASWSIWVVTRWRRSGH